MAEARPVIVVKKKGTHGGHHGGAWKVAYADFVTAMMSLFIVLWLLNSSKQIQVAVGGYFKDPTGTSKKVGSDMQGTGESVNLNREQMENLKEELQHSVRDVANFEELKDYLRMTVTQEGLRIELLEGKEGTFFANGSSALNGNGQEVLMKLAQVLGTLPNKVSIEGHTDSTPYPGGANYTNWELSTDRSNSARRLMQQNGVRQGQVIAVRGYADQQPRILGHPEDPSNRRISIIVQYTVRRDDPNAPVSAPSTSSVATSPGQTTLSSRTAPAPSSKATVN